jgi:hypothetical protein
MAQTITLTPPEKAKKAAQAAADYYGEDYAYWVEQRRKPMIRAISEYPSAVQERLRKTESFASIGKFQVRLAITNRDAPRENEYRMAKL